MIARASEPPPSEDGNVAVMVALLLLVFLWVAALGVDLGAGWAGQRTLVADLEAAALGGATGFRHHGVPTCTDEGDEGVRGLVYQVLADNDPEGLTTIEEPVIDCAARTVTLTGSRPTIRIFAPEDEGITTATVSARTAPAAKLIPLSICRQEFDRDGQDDRWLDDDRATPPRGTRLTIDFDYSAQLDDAIRSDCRLHPHGNRVGSWGWVFSHDEEEIERLLDVTFAPGGYGLLQGNDGFFPNDASVCETDDRAWCRGLTVSPIPDPPAPPDPDPVDPTDPEEPGEPEDPIDPEEPGEPEDPTDPEEPGEPEDPTDPEEPGEPDPAPGTAFLPRLEAEIDGCVVTESSVCPPLVSVLVHDGSETVSGTETRFRLRGVLDVRLIDVELEDPEYGGRPTLTVEFAAYRQFPTGQQLEFRGSPRPYLCVEDSPNTEISC